MIASLPMNHQIDLVAVNASDDLNNDGGGLAQWFRARAADGRSGTRKTMIVALARKLLIALWRMTTMGEIPERVILRAA